MLIMLTDCIPFKKTNYFSSLICDYLDEKKELQKFYNRFPNLDSFKDQIEEKQKSFSNETRKHIVEVLKQQYKNIKASQETLNNIDNLKFEKTFTVTTGHQLNLFTGPLYFLYKIVSTINLTKQLKQRFPKYNFVPIYWMATEDHDFEEINYFNFKGKKVQWSKSSKGAVGELSTKGLEEVYKVFSKTLGIGKNADDLNRLFKEAYIKHNDLASATRYLANALFSHYGLVILDANEKDLKRAFVPYMKDELQHETAFKAVSKTNQDLNKFSKYTIQVNPREINLFYLIKDLRERIVFKEGRYNVLNTTLSWTEKELHEELTKYPERFSPNVIMRPLYQEVILPNLCYIGGGGELAYWLQLKAYFEKNKVSFPMLLLRNSVLVKTEKQTMKQEKLNLSNEDLFLKQNDLAKKMTKAWSVIAIDFSDQKAHLEKQFIDLYKLAKETDESFIGAVSAQEKKQKNGLEHLEKRLLKAQKHKFGDKLQRIKVLQDSLFPNQSLQERHHNFSELYLEYGSDLISNLIANLNPLQGEFMVLTI